MLDFELSSLFRTAKKRKESSPLAHEDFLSNDVLCHGILKMRISSSEKKKKRER